MKIKEGRGGGKVERKTEGRRGIRREGAGEERCEEGQGRGRKEKEKRKKEEREEARR